MENCFLNFFWLVQVVFGLVFVCLHSVHLFLVFFAISFLDIGVSLHAHTSLVIWMDLEWMDGWMDKLGICSFF
jgi:hypothetical protein